MIRMFCGVRLLDRVLTDVLRDSVGVTVKMEDLVMSSKEASTPKCMRLWSLK